MKLGLKNNISTKDVHFTPNLLPNLLAWYKFYTGIEEEDESSPEDGEAVFKWQDSKGSNHLTASDDAPAFNEADKSILFVDADKELGTTSEITLDKTPSSKRASFIHSLISGFNTFLSSVFFII